MQYLRNLRSIFRKLILLGWAFVVIWMYLGNLVNFHQNRIWGKQLIPIACYSTRAKEKDGALVDRSDSDYRIALPGLNVDFTILGQQSLYFVPTFFITLDNYQVDPNLIEPKFTSFSFRGPPTV